MYWISTWTLSFFPFSWHDHIKHLGKYAGNSHFQNSRKKLSHSPVQSCLLHRLHVSVFSLIHTSENTAYSPCMSRQTLLHVIEQLSACVSLQVSVGRYGQSAVGAWDYDARPYLLGERAAWAGRGSHAGHRSVAPEEETVWEFLRHAASFHTRGQRQV